MCTPDQAGCALAAPGRGFASVADALRVTSAAAVYLNSEAAGDLEGPARGEALEQLGAIASLLGAARNGLLRRFDADDGHDADGYATAAAWLAARTKLGRNDARAAVRQMRLLARHPVLDAATATGAVTISWAREIAGWTGRIGHQELQSRPTRSSSRRRRPGRTSTTSGFWPGRLRGLARAGARPRRGPGRAGLRRPGPAPGDHDGRGREGPGRPDPRVAAAVTAVMEALGKPRGPEDLRSPGQRCRTTPSRRAAGSSSAPRWSPTGRR